MHDIAGRPQERERITVGAQHPLHPAERLLSHRPPEGRLGFRIRGPVADVGDDADDLPLLSPEVEETSEGVAGEVSAGERFVNDDNACRRGSIARFNESPLK